jgi:putative ABC transport system ATP-binding protein
MVGVAASALAERKNSRAAGSQNRFIIFKVSSDMNNSHSNVFVEARSVGKTVISGEGRLTLLDDINFSVTAGTSVAVLGASGSGKTTLLGLLAGLDEVSQGEIIIDGHNLAELDEDGRAELRANSIGFVFQNFQLLQSLTALENVMLPLELAGSAQAAASGREMLARVGLENRGSHYPNQLSGGEQQRCAIARAFAVQPRLLFADEPTGNLDAGTGQRIIDLLFALNAEQGTTLIMATHDTALADKCDRRLQLQAGRLFSDAASVIS